MTQKEFYPCLQSQSSCRFYERWRVNPEDRGIFIGRMSNVEVMRAVFVCLICKHFNKRSMMMMP